jgi:hypothetical protein
MHGSRGVHARTWARRPAAPTASANNDFRQRQVLKPNFGSKLQTSKV